MNEEVLEWVNPASPGGPHFKSLPFARIALTVLADGRWMWGVRYADTSGLGFGFAPLEKWGKFAISRERAIFAAAEEIRERAGERLDSRVAAWLDRVANPQTKLFPSASAEHERLR